MTLELNLWQTLVALGSVAAFSLGAIAGGAVFLHRMMTASFERQFFAAKGELDARFQLIEAARTEAQTHWNFRLQPLEQHTKEAPTLLGSIHERISQIQAMLPTEYVRREDWIRLSTVIDAKMDSLGDKLDSMIERRRAPDA